jgi:hypothetical protein
MNQLARRALLVIVLGGGSILTVAWAQTPDAKGPKKEPAQAAANDQLDPQPGPDEAAFDPPAGNPPPFFSGGGGMGPGGSWSGTWGEHGHHGMVRRAFPHPMGREEMQEFEAFHRAVGKLKSAKNDADKTSATTELSKMLEKSFQRDLERREHEIAHVEARVKKLRDQIEKRKKSKEDIISLRLKTIVNEADGLGFPGGFGPEAESFSPRPRAFRVPGPPHNVGYWVGAEIPEAPAPPSGVPAPEAP